MSSITVCILFYCGREGGPGLQWERTKPFKSRLRGMCLEMGWCAGDMQMCALIVTKAGSIDFVYVILMGIGTV